MKIKRPLRKGSKEVQILSLVENWTKHSYRQKSPMEGEPVGVEQVEKLIEKEDFQECYEASHPEGKVVLYYSSTLWFTCDAEDFREAKKAVERAKAERRAMWRRMRGADFENSY